MPSEEAIDFACKRIEDLAAVHRGKDTAKKLEALELFAQSVGIDEELRAYLDTSLRRIVNAEDAENLIYTVLGVYLGLLMAEFTHERQRSKAY